MNKSTLNNRKEVGITSSLFAHNVSPKIVIIDNRRCQHVKASWWLSDWRFLSKRASQIFQFYDSLLRFKLKSPCTECIHTKNVSFLNFLEPFQSHDSHLVSERKAAKLREDWIPSSKKTIYDCYFYFLLPTYSWKKIRPFCFWPCQIFFRWLTSAYSSDKKGIEKLLFTKRVPSKLFGRGETACHFQVSPNKTSYVLSLYIIKRRFKLVFSRKCEQQKNALLKK